MNLVTFEDNTYYYKVIVASSPDKISEGDVWGTDNKNEAEKFFTSCGAPNVIFCAWGRYKTKNRKKIEDYAIIKAKDGSGVFSKEGFGVPLSEQEYGIIEFEEMEPPVDGGDGEVPQRNESPKAAMGTCSECHYKFPKPEMKLVTDYSYKPGSVRVYRNRYGTTTGRSEGSGRYTSKERWLCVDCNKKRWTFWGIARRLLGI